MPKQIESETERRLDRIAEGEVAKGYRVKHLPAAVREELANAGLRDIAAVRFSGNNPRRRRTASELVQRQYQADLKRPEILSNEQVMGLVVERGEWSPAKDARVAELIDSTNKLMGALYAAGVATRSQEWANEVLELAAQVREAIDGLTTVDAVERERLQRVLSRWMDFNPDKEATFTTLYAPEQKRDIYSHFHDLETIGAALAFESTEASQLLEVLQERLEKVNQFAEMVDRRRELAELQTKRNHIFADTVESRRDHNEELARLYTTCEALTEDEKPLGPLAKEYDGVWDFPDEAIKWLTEESYLYHARISDEMRDYLGTWGFLTAERSKPGEPAPSAESPEAPSSESESGAAGTTSAGSSELPPVTT